MSGIFTTLSITLILVTRCSAQKCSLKRLLCFDLCDTAGYEAVCYEVSSLKDIAELSPITEEETLYTNIIIKNIEANLKLEESPIGFIRVNKLIMKRVGLETIPPNAFSYFKDAIELDLSMNKLQSIDELSFLDLANLRRLNLSCNIINSIHVFAFKHQTQLTHLYLDHNKLVALSTSLFSNQNLLVELDLSNNPLEIFDTSILQNSRELVILSLAGLNLTQNKLNFENHKKLERLRLNNNKISEISKNLFSNLRLLVELDLSSNAISKIDRSCLKNVTIKELKLNDNFITSLGEILNSQIYLGHLDVSSNPLQADDIWKTQNISGLDRLYMNHANVTADGLSFTTLSSNLSEISLKHNQIKTVHNKMFLNLYYLKSIHLDYNNISVITEIAFSGLNNLQVVTLRGNNLKFLPTSIFNDLKLLEYLDLSENDLSEFTTDLSSNWQSLVVLNLSDNNIAKLNKTSLLPFTGLRDLYMHNNKLSSLEGINFMSSLRNVSLQNNKWTCNYLLNLLHDLDREQVALLKVASERKLVGQLYGNLRGIYCLHVQDDICKSSDSSNDFCNMNQEAELNIGESTCNEHSPTVSYVLIFFACANFLLLAYVLYVIRQPKEDENLYENVELR